ncbi:MAG: haloalkane dehalogenase [Gammaproteobacteria bacterium RIFCSPHIGHO2_12_FULL_41_15]|nr:MAG: haloalkane dehalogenase [Gammaproteobacteria bacterium RIFCSPHIGHO2_12_FULL_41_15]
MTVSQGLRSEQTFPSKFVKVLDSEMHYVEVGSGDPILFVHGIPTSSYLWRYILPACQQDARAIAVDLIGFGQSSKPHIDYSVEDHFKYLSAFINTMKLDRLTLVLHGWGSIPGLQYAALNEEKIKGVVLYESHIRPITDFNMLSLPVQQLATLLRDEKEAKKAVIEDNFFVEKWLHMGAVNKLSPEVVAEYRKPFATQASRQPLWQYAKELPIGNKNTKAFHMIQSYNHWLRDTQVPLCLMYAIPGLITPMSTVAWAKENIDNLQLVELNDVMHFVQESKPDLFSEALLRWYRSVL